MYKVNRRTYAKKNVIICRLVRVIKYYLTNHTFNWMHTLAHDMTYTVRFVGLKPKFFLKTRVASEFYNYFVGRAMRFLHDRKLQRSSLSSSGVYKLGPDRRRRGNGLKNAYTNHTRSICTRASTKTKKKIPDGWRGDEGWLAAAAKKTTRRAPQTGLVPFFFFFVLLFPIRDRNART